VAIQDANVVFRCHCLLNEMISVRSDQDHLQIIISQAPTEPGPLDYLAIQMKIVDCMPPPILSFVGIENGHDRIDSCKVCGSGRFLCDPLLGRVLYLCLS